MPRRKATPDPKTVDIDDAPMEAAEGDSVGAPIEESHEVTHSENGEAAVSDEQLEIVAEAAAAAEEPEAPKAILPANVTDEELAVVAASLIFASTKPLSSSRLSELLGHAPGRIRAGLAAMDERLKSAGVPFKLAEIAGGFRYMTDESVAKYVAVLRGEQKKERLSTAALETLAIIAYRQPVSKGEIEAMRGVQAGPMLRMLLEKRFIKIVGRAPVPGRPLQYGTTKEFLDKFNLASLKDLPTSEELSKP
ncbi:MAG: SMC-Scp complex subunit ScpB [Planctomycetota bacterium]